MPTPIVSNSSPIIHLAKIDQLDLLTDFFGEVLIPPAVYEECVTDGKGRPEVAKIKQVSGLQVVQVVNQNLVKLLNAEVDRGEAEAIALALETGASPELREKPRRLRRGGIAHRAKRGQTPVGLTSIFLCEYNHQYENRTANQIAPG